MAGNLPVVFGRRFALSAQPRFLSLSSSKKEERAVERRRFLLISPLSDSLPARSSRGERGKTPQAFCVPIRTGILPTVEPGIHPPQCDGGFGPARQIVACLWHNQPRRGRCYRGRVLAGGIGALCGKAPAIWHRRPGGKPPSTAAKMAAATHLLLMVNTRRERCVSRSTPKPSRGLVAKMLLPGRLVYCLNLMKRSCSG